MPRSAGSASTASLAISFGIVFLGIMLVTIVSKGYTAFWQTTVTLPITFDEKVIDPGNKRATDPSVLIAANYPVLARDALAAKLGIDLKRQAAARQAQGLPVRRRAHAAARHGDRRSRR